jgi:hypothetical protein
MLRLPLGPRVPAFAARVAGVAAAVVVAGAVAVALTPWPVWVRAAAAVLLVGFAAVVHRVLARRRRPPLGWLVVDHEGIRRHESDAPLLVWRDPFGVSVLGSADRSRFLLVLTTPRATRLLGVRVLDPGDAAEAPWLFDRAATSPEVDARADRRPALCAADAEVLLHALAARAPGALDRAYMSDAGGEAVVLDRGELRVAGRRVDLSAPLEWRAFVYEEHGAHAVTLWQATWVRQGDGEVVFVAPMAGDLALPRGGPGDAVGGRSEAAESSARQAPAPLEMPPPRELRRAIDGLFMVPLWRALDHAPRPSRASSARRRRAKGERERA